MYTINTEQAKHLIEQAAALLASTGFEVQHDELLDIAAEAGCTVDREAQRVRFPEPVLMKLLGTTPRSYTVRNLLGDKTVIGGDSATTPGMAIVTDPWIIDYKTRETRRPRLEDLRRHAAAAQALDSVYGVSCMHFSVEDAPGPASVLRAFEEHLLYHTKHYVTMPVDMEQFHERVEIAEILLGGADPTDSGILSVAVAVQSPLTLDDMNSELLMECCHFGFPVIPTICPMSGTTGPYSKTGTLLLGIAENMGMAALLQAVRPGALFLFTFGPSVSDMRSGFDKYYTLDKALWKHAAVIVGHELGMPAAAECGGGMTSLYDVQQGAEGMLFMLAAVDAGADVLSGYGSFYNSMGMSGEMMFIQDAWRDAAEFITRGLDTGALERERTAIESAGPSGNYLMDDLTIENLRSGEFFEHALFDYAGGEGAAHSMLKRAHERLEAISVDARPVLPDTVREPLLRWFRQRYDEIRRGTK